MDGRDPLIVVDIVVPEGELVRRLATRRVCESCGAERRRRTRRWRSTCQRCGGALEQRADDSEAVVLERLKVYHRNTEPLVDYYRARPTFRSVDGAQPPERVAADLAAAVEAAANGAAGSGRGDRLPVGGGARADARGRAAGRRGADGSWRRGWRRA